MKQLFENHLNCMFTAPFYVEYTAKEVHKVYALNTVLPHLGYHKYKVIAFGDGHNDANIIKLARLGITMENAVESLKEIADFVTRWNKEDGINYALSKFYKGL